MLAEKVLQSDFSIVFYMMLARFVKCYDIKLLCYRLRKGNRLHLIHHMLVVLFVKKANQVKVRDHCHLTGYYRGPSHQECNLNYRINPDKMQIPCFFHNLKHYDAHLLIAAAKKHHGNIKVIPTNTKKYISFTIGDVTFKDSYAFTQTSLEKLVDNLEIYQLVNTRKWLELNIKQCYENSDDNSSDNDEKMDWETDYDISFIDNRSPDQHLAKSNSRYYFAATDDDDDDNDNDDDDDNEFSHKHNFDSNDDNEDFIRSERCRMAIKDDDDEDDVDDVHNDIINNNSENFNVDDTFTYGDEYDDDMLFQMAGEDVDIYTKEMPEFDYRHNVYTESTLTEEEQHLVDEDLILLKRKGVYPYE